MPLVLLILLWISLSYTVHAQSEPSISPAPVEKKTPIPNELKAWEDWVLWDDKQAKSPPVFDNSGIRISLWPSTLSVLAEPKEGRFSLSVRVYGSAWLPMPGNADLWPQQVQIDDKPAIVVERDGRPATRLEPGSHRVTGVFPWNSIPERLAIPPEIGVLDLSMNGTPVQLPNRDASGFLWLKRNRAEEEAEREFLDAKVYRVLEDGIPMWLHTQIELSVAGKSREESLGYALPEGWQVSSVESRLPCAVDDGGRVRVQVRAGKWDILIAAFRPGMVDSIGFAENQKPIASQEILGFQAKPDFRLVELREVQAIDVSQTTFPEKWRKLPVSIWDTSKPFRIEEKMRGMGFQKPSGLSVNREFWLDDDGGLMTFRDNISGTSQQVWRLDVSPGQSLGAARMDGEGQLITKNPTGGANGIEVRQRQINLEAIGRIENSRQFPASGWQADVDKCEATLHLPPGWRVLALFGAEWVNGDWLTNWTLLDLFLLLVFTMAVGKLWGFVPALIAMLGFGLSYHEPGAPRFVWFLLLIPVAILRVRLTGRARTLAEIGKYFACAVLLLVLLPFIGRQVQGVLYPQLEPGGLAEVSSIQSDRGSSVSGFSYRKKEAAAYEQKAVNLKQDAQARIQTGPAVPAWSWRDVNFGWRGPVTPSESVTILLIPPSIQRCIAVFRVIMVILIATILLGTKRLLPRSLRRDSWRPPELPKINPGAVTLAILFLPGFYQAASAQEFPPQPLLDKLRERLLETSDSFPGAADISEVNLVIGKSSLTMVAQIHAAAQVAVPLPGQLAAWSPQTVTVDNVAADAVVRRNDYLWIVLEPGVHTVKVEGLLPNSTEWAWSFLLPPRVVRIDAPNWVVTGINPNGIPEKQIFFTLKNPAIASEAAYDRKDFTPAVAVERSIELGLIWQVRSTLTRLSPGGKGVALSIPLLAGERVLSPHVTVENGKVNVRLGAGEDKVLWESELPQTESIALEASQSNLWVERWRLIASPVWNVGFTGLTPVYEPSSEGLEPVWRPWPGEKATLQLSRPEAVPGATMTVRAVDHITKVGSRQRISLLKLNLQASLGQDFPLDLPTGAEVTSLTIGDENNPNGTQQPVRRDGDRVIIPVRPGEQLVDLEWKILRAISTRETVDTLDLPVESSNISSTISLPNDRWVLWTSGPLRGPAVQLWGILLLSLIVAIVLGRLRSSPLRGAEWGLLALGITQVHYAGALLVVIWFFLIDWRGSERALVQRPLIFNFVQVMIVVLAIPVVVTLLCAMHRGLLGMPEMMVKGNQSSATYLQWFAQRTERILPEAGVLSVSIWYYRILMLAWALWLAISALRWVRWGWTQFTMGSMWKSSEKGEKPASLG